MDEIIQHPEKKNLLISYHFPPSSAVGGARMAKFARALPLFGWDVSVLTINEKFIHQKDPGQLNGLDQIKIIRTTLLPTASQFYSWIKNCWGFKRKHATSIRENFKKSSSHPTEKPKNFIRQIKRYIISLLLTLPDSERNWIFPASFKAIKEIRRQKINCIITTSPPVSVNLIGLLAKTVTGVKWIADFRDPWLNEAGGKRLHTTCTLSLKIEHYLEKKVMQNADSILTTTFFLRDRYRKQYSFLPKKKFVCLSNGFDVKAFSTLTGFRKFDKFTLTYAGTLYLGRTPKPIFEVLHSLFKRGKILPERVCIKLIGKCDQIDGCPTSEMIHTYGLDSVVEIVKPVPYEKVLEIIAKSHLAILLAPNQPMQIPAKLFDYIGSGIPVIALAGPGATTDFITANKVGKTFDPEDKEGMIDFLLQAINGGGLKIYNNNEVREKFEIKTLTKDLDAHLSALVFPT